MEWSNLTYNIRSRSVNTNFNLSMDIGQYVVQYFFVFPQESKLMEFKLNQDSLRLNYFHAALLDSNFLCCNTKQDESEAAALKTTMRMSKDNTSTARVAVCLFYLTR